jgi:hypothetical protein
MEPISDYKNNNELRAKINNLTQRLHRPKRNNFSPQQANHTYAESLG